MLGNCTTSACLCLRLAQLAEAGEDLDEHSALAKAVCTVRMRETVGWARELLGGNGIMLPRSELALSGILFDQVETVTAAYRPWFDIGPAAEREGWTLLAGRRRLE